MIANAWVDASGDWFEVHFHHSLNVAHSLKGLGGERKALGVWEVPVAKALALQTIMDRLQATWTPEAAARLERAAAIERQLMQEDEAALAVKRGDSGLEAVETKLPLMPHQHVAARFLSMRTGALLCDEQGLGKTLSTLAAFELLQRQGMVKQLLVVCPNSLKWNWFQEIARYFPEWAACVISGGKAKRRKLYQLQVDVCIVNYESVRSDYAELRVQLRTRATVIVCDESHAAKNFDSNTARALRFMRSAAARVWLLSGTPVPNRLDDCYSQVSIADGGRTFGNRQQFQAQYPEGMSSDRSITIIRNKLQPIMLRRTKEEVLDLPMRSFESRYVELTGLQKQLYENLARQTYDQVKGMSDQEFDRATMSVLTRLLRLSQFASNPRLVMDDFTGDPAKFLEIDSLLETLIDGNGRKVVLWSSYVKNIKEFLARYARYKPVAIFGEVPLEERGRAVEMFQGKPDVMLFIGNPQAAGTGITLTAAAYAIYETLTWRYDLYAQSLDRIHRIGQDKNVTCVKVMGLHTIDMDIDQNLQGKADRAADVLGDTQRIPKFKRSEVLSMLAQST